MSGPSPVQIGPCTLYCGDALTVLADMPPESVAAVVTDPPYSSGGAFRGDRMATTRVKYQSTDAMVEHPEFSGDNRDQRGWLAWVSMWMAACRIVADPGAIACLFSDWRQLPTCTDAVQAGGWVWRGVVPWDKVNARPMPGRFRAQAEFIIWATNGPRAFDMNDTSARYHDGAFRIGTTPTEDREHSTQKPVELMDKLVAVADPNAVVLDPFMGSGTTGVACIRTGRKFIGIELVPRYFAIACRKIQDAVDDGALFAQAAPKAEDPALFGEGGAG